MVQNLKKIGENRYRESFGRYYEDFVVGDIYEHRPGRTVTQNENIWFTLITMNTHPMHFDEEYAKHSEFGKCIVASPFTLALRSLIPISSTAACGSPERMTAAIWPSICPTLSSA